MRFASRAAIRASALSARIIAGDARDGTEAGRDRSVPIEGGHAIRAVRDAAARRHGGARRVRRLAIEKGSRSRHWRQSRSPSGHCRWPAVRWDSRALLLAGRTRPTFRRNGAGGYGGNHSPQITVKRSTGGGPPSRYFYCPKATRKEKTHAGRVQNDHNTVKPVNLCRWLARLTRPPDPADDLVLDPFCGSGSLLVGAKLEGRRVMAIDRNPHYVNITRQRLYLTPMGLGV